MYHEVHIKLSPAEKYALAAGSPIEITARHLSHGHQKHPLHVSKAQYAKMQKTHSTGKSHKFKMTQAQIRHHDGFGFFDMLKSGAASLLKKGAQLAIDKGLPALANAGGNFLQGKLDNFNAPATSGSGFRSHAVRVGDVGLNQLAVAGQGHSGDGLLSSLLPIVTQLLPLISGGHLVHSKRGGGIHNGDGFFDSLISAAGPLLKAGLPLLMGAGIHPSHRAAANELARLIQHHHNTRHHRRGHHGKGVIGDMFPTLGLLGFGVKKSGKAGSGIYA